MTKLQQQLKSASMSSKGGQAEVDRLKKELEKTRCVPQPCPLSLQSIQVSAHPGSHLADAGLKTSLLYTFAPDLAWVHERVHT
jgi:hypothetical protein